MDKKELRGYSFYLSEKEGEFGNENSLSYIADLFNQYQDENYPEEIFLDSQKRENGILTLLRITGEDELEMYQYRLPNGVFNLIKFLESEGFVLKG